MIAILLSMFLLTSSLQIEVDNVSTGTWGNESWQGLVKVEAYFTNYTGEDINYSPKIYYNGNVKQLKTITVPAMETISMEYWIVFGDPGFEKFYQEVKQGRVDVRVR